MKKLLLSAVVGCMFFSSPVKAQIEPFIGQISFVGFNFAPRGWAECNGQTLSIAQNTALFSLLGTMYGGDGITTFKLPDMRGRVLVHSGIGPGLTPYTQGETGGLEAVALTVNQIPAHSHTLLASTADGDTESPANSVPANTKILDKEYTTGTPNTNMRANGVTPTGGNQPHENRPPYIALKCIIALQGIYPTRD